MELVCESTRDDEEDHPLLKSVGGVERHSLLYRQVQPQKGRGGWENSSCFDPREDDVMSSLV